MVLSELIELGLALARAFRWLKRSHAVTAGDLDRGGIGRAGFDRLFLGIRRASP